MCVDDEIEGQFVLAGDRWYRLSERGKLFVISMEQKPCHFEGG